VEKKVYDLEERCARFGENVIAFCKRVPLNAITRPLVSQIIRSSTSIGDNYCEADDAVSKKEFRQKIGYCKKEARETKFWFRMIVAAVETLGSLAKPLSQEVGELHRIFAAIWRRSDPSD
jgi:four helix bundle protein